MPPIYTSDAPVSGGRSTAAAQAAMQHFTESVFNAFFDDASSNLVVEVGRKAAICRQGSWTEIGDKPISRAVWNTFWQSFCQIAHIDPRQSGYVSTLLGESAVVEAVLPPLAWRPTFMASKRPQPTTLGGLQERSGISSDHANSVRSALKAGHGILIIGTPRSGRTSFAEAVVAEIDQGERVALVEHKTQIRYTSPQVIRLRDRAASAVNTAVTVSPDWIVVDDASAETLAAAAMSAIPTVAVVRGSDATVWHERAGALLPETIGNADHRRLLISHAFPTTVQLSWQHDAVHADVVHSGHRGKH